VSLTIKELEAKSILRKHKKIDSWFLSNYGMNLYRGCLHNCVYCDGRAEGYYVEGQFGSDVAVKVNALEILRRELDPKRKRSPFKRGYVMVGGGVGDS
jgi:DNA repair photolyase